MKGVPARSASTATRPNDSYLEGTSTQWLLATAALFSAGKYAIGTYLGNSRVADPYGVAGSIVLLLLWAYWTGFELAWSGQSPGKRLMRIRVVRSDGSPVTLFASATRNLLRLVDFVPACYPLGAAVMLIDSKHRRLGDLLAGTLLVREDRVDLSRYAQATSELQVDVLEVATGWLARWTQLEPEPRDRIGRTLMESLGGDVSLTGEALRDELRARVTKR